MSMSIKGKLIYVLGAGRSGTTLLEIVLANQPKNVGVGEINRFPVCNGVPHGGSKGEPTFDFWEKVVRNISLEIDIARLETIYHKLEYHLYPLKRSKVSKEDYAYYQSFNQQFYKAIYSEIGEDCTIIESSKYPGRLSELSKVYDPKDISVVYLKRDPISVVRSFQKKGIEQPPKPALSSILYYFVVNLLCSTLAKRLEKKSKVCTINYEDFVNDPKITITKISKDLEIPLDAVFDKLKNGEGFAPGPMFDGNRIRLKKSIQLKSTNPPKVKSFIDFLARWINKPFY